MPPREVNYRGVTYAYKKQLGKGSTGSVSLYGNESVGYVVLKISYCNDPKGQEEFYRELRAVELLQRSAAAGCSQQSLHWRWSTSQALELPSSFIRMPLSWKAQDGCFYTLLDYYPSNLAQWLQQTPDRSVEQVVGIFLQVASMISCLREHKLYYNDLKPSNLLVKLIVGDPVPRIVIGDLGGLDVQGDTRITVTPSRLPKSLLEHLQWKDLDVVTSFLLGELILQLLLRPPSGAPRSNAMNDFLRCLLEDTPSDSCVERALLPALSTSLAPRLSLSDSRVLNLAALALNLLGYQGWRLSLEDAWLLQGSPFSS